MFGFSAGVNAYSRVGVETGVVAANPARLVSMMYDGAIAACNLAIKHIHAEDYAAKSAALTKAIMIVNSGFRARLDKESGGEIAESLDALYAYMETRLYRANLKNEVTTLDEVIGLLNELNEAWATLADQPQASQAPNTTKAYSL